MRNIGSLKYPTLCNTAHLAKTSTMRLHKNGMKYTSQNSYGWVYPYSNGTFHQGMKYRGESRMRQTENVGNNRENEPALPVPRSYPTFRENRAGVPQLAPSVGLKPRLYKWSSFPLKGSRLSYKVPLPYIFEYHARTRKKVGLFSFFYSTAFDKNRKVWELASFCYVFCRNIYLGYLIGL